MSLAATAMSGCALKWWRWWSPLHPNVSWDEFTTSFLWRFKPEYRPILPFDEEEEPGQESSPLELDDGSEELHDVLKAWDVFLLSADEMEVPPTRTINGGNVYLPEAATTTNEVIENPKSLGDSNPQRLMTITPLQENFRLPSFDSLLIKNFLPPHHLAPFDGTDLLEDWGKWKMTMTTISIMLPLHFVSLFDPGGTHLRTTSPLPETHGVVGSFPPPPEPPHWKYGGMDMFIAVCYPLKPTYIMGNGVFVLVLYLKFCKIGTACQVFAEMPKRLVGCSNSLLCLSITAGRLNEKELLSYDALSKRLGAPMMVSDLTQSFSALTYLSVRATWIFHVFALCNVRFFISGWHSIEKITTPLPKPSNDGHGTIPSEFVSLCFPHYFDALHDLNFHLVTMLYLTLLQENRVLIDEQVNAIRCITSTYDQLALLDLCSKFGDVGTTQLVLDDMLKMILDCSNSFPVGYIKAVALDGKELLSYVFVYKCWLVVAMQVVYGNFYLMRLICGCSFVYCVLMLKKRDINSCSSSIVLGQYGLIHHCLGNAHHSRWLHSQAGNISNRTMLTFLWMSPMILIGNTIGSTQLVAHMVSKGFGFNYTTYTGFCIGVPLEGATSLTQVSNKTYFYVSAAALVQFLSVHPSNRVPVTNVEITRVLAYQAQHAKLSLVRVQLFVFAWHSKKRDPGGGDYFFHSKGSLQCRQWDPGGNFLFSGRST